MTNKISFINKFIQKPRLSPKQRLQNKIAYYKRRLIRVHKRTKWLKRKNYKRLKRAYKQRRQHMLLPSTKQCSLVYKKIVNKIIHPRHTYTAISPVKISIQKEYLPPVSQFAKASFKKEKCIGLKHNYFKV